MCIRDRFELLLISSAMYHEKSVPLLLLRKLFSTYNNNTRNCVAGKGKANYERINSFWKLLWSLLLSQWTRNTSTFFYKVFFGSILIITWSSTFTQRVPIQQTTNVCSLQEKVQILHHYAQFTYRNWNICKLYWHPALSGLLHLKVCLLSVRIVTSHQLLLFLLSCHPLSSMDIHYMQRLHLWVSYFRIPVSYTHLTLPTIYSV